MRCRFLGRNGLRPGMIAARWFGSPSSAESLLILTLYGLPECVRNFPPYRQLFSTAFSNPDPVRTRGGVNSQPMLNTCRASKSETPRSEVTSNTFGISLLVVCDCVCKSIAFEYVYDISSVSSFPPRWVYCACRLL